MRMLGTNDLNDIFLGPDGNIVVVLDVDAVLQACAHAAKAQLGEMVLDIDEGIPNFQTIWRNAVNVPQFEAALRATLENVQGVVEVQQLDVIAQNNVVTYAATIQTIYGQGVING